MKRANSISVVLIVSISLFINLSAQNPIPNYSFEYWTNNIWPDDWSVYDLEGISKVTGHTGFAPHLGGTNYLQTDYNGEIYFPINQHYTHFKLYYRGNFTQGQPGNYSDFRINYYEFDEEKHILGGTSIWLYDYNSTNDWTEIISPRVNLWNQGESRWAHLQVEILVDSLNIYWIEVDDFEMLNIIEIEVPNYNDKWIAGEKDTIRWDGGSPSQTLMLEYSEDDGNTYHLIDLVFPADTGKYGWEISSDILSTKLKIRIKDNVTQDVLAESERFRIKPYIITRLDYNGDYIAYDIDIDRWGFANRKEEMWPVWWWLRFNYQVKIDIFTNKLYDQRQGDSVFAKTHMSKFPDWISWVNAFSVDRCYHSTSLGIYKRSALLKWKAANPAGWKGSCFGIAAANALAFVYRDAFVNKYTNFPNFIDPITVTTGEEVIPVISELWTHQLGNPTILYRANCWVPSPGKTVNETLNEIKAMLIEDNTPIRTLSMWNNSNLNEGHTIIPYELTPDSDDKWLYYLWVYDNSYPDSTAAIITIDTTAYSNKGKFDPVYCWPNWGGDKWFILEVSSDNYLSSAILPKSSASQSLSFYWPMAVEIDVTEDADIIIVDSLGNRLGYSNNNVIFEIPDGLPLMTTDPIESPPYGYVLELRNYSVVLDNFQADTVDAYFFSENNAFSYERYGAVNTETDRLFFDGGISATNPDNQTKTVKLLSLIDDTTSAEDKMIVIKSLELEQSDSVKITPIDDNNFSLISYGSAKEYTVGLEYASESQWQIFGNNNVQLSANTTHTFVPNWPNIYSNELTILVDEGNNGIIDDTLHVVNQITAVNDDQGSLPIPDEYRLGQNYPNPFNSSTVIKYSLPEEGLVTLDIYNSIGEKVATLVEEVKEAGNYTLTYDATDLTSGVYFYRLQAGDFIQTKKMILMK